MITDVVIPALNEEKSIFKVIEDLPKSLVRNIVVADNGSTDRTVELAKSAGAIVVHEPRKGYGSACLKALEYIHQQEILPDAILFIDGDYSDHPEEAALLLEPIRLDEYDLVIGSRVSGDSERGSLTAGQIVGNRIAAIILNSLYDIRITDLGPFRAIRYSSLKSIGMCDPDFGWTVEMQVKAAKQKLRFKEVPVSYRKRIGKSKISGTVIGSIKAGYKILYTIFKLL